MDIQYLVRPGYRPLLMDVLTPSGNQLWPAVLFIHGGGFTSGSHKPEHYALLQDLSDVVLAAGLAIASVQYRLSQEARFPGPLHDLKAALSWLRRNGAKVGIDGSRVGAFGDSARGYFAALLATTAQLSGFQDAEDQTRMTIAAAVSWFSPMNLEMQPVNRTAGLYTPEDELLGAKVEESVERALWASPITHVNGDSAPLLMIHGGADELVPVRQSECMHAAYQRAGAISELIVIPGGGHGLLEADQSALLGASTNHLLRYLFP